MVADLENRPFILDTGGHLPHIPERTDFKTLDTIFPYLMRGLGGSCVYAIGVGTIELRIAKGRKLTLQNLLSIPTSTIRLISVLTLNRAGRLTSHFGSDSC